MDERDSEGLKQISQIFNIDAKKDLEKYCRSLVVRRKDLFHLIVAGRAAGLHPYKYACHFAQISPHHLNPNERELAALAANGVGPLSRTARKVVTKISQLHVQRRLFSAHLFYTASGRFWHLFYFDQRDTTGQNNHWRVGGPHIHYSRESFCREALREVWRSICDPQPRPPSSIHIRYAHSRNRE